jgi:glycosyltransferase involved in cell wall biosynthesis
VLRLSPCRYGPATSPTPDCRSLSPRVVFFGTYDAQVHPRVGVLIEGVRSAGIAVAECNVPVGLSTADRVLLLRQPWRVLGASVRLIMAWTRLISASRRIGPVDAVVVGYLGHLDVHLARRLFPGVPIVLDLLVFLADTAADRGVGGGWRAGMLRLLDDRAIRAADLILVDTPEHAELVPREQRGRAVVVPVGAPEAWLSEPRPVGTAPLRVIFFGLFTPLQGAPVIGEAMRLLAERPDITFSVIGGGQHWEETRRRAGDGARCTWSAWIAPAELPSLVAEHDVCLGIFGDAPKSVRVVPNKVYQGAAAGCAVVTSDTPPQRRALGDAALFVPPRDPAALALALTSLADDRELLAHLKRAGHALARGEYRPVRVVRPLLERLRLGEVDGRL